MNITRLNIGTRLAIGFGVVMLLMATIATIGVVRLTDEYNTADETINGIYPRASKAESRSDPSRIKPKSHPAYCNRNAGMWPLIAAPVRMVLSSDKLWRLLHNTGNYRR